MGRIERAPSRRVHYDGGFWNGVNEERECHRWCWRRGEGRLEDDGFLRLGYKGVLGCVLRGGRGGIFGYFDWRTGDTFFGVNVGNARFM